MIESKPILIVEDSPIQRLILQRMLEQAGYSIVIAQDGVEGLQAARQHQPRLIIADVTMPNMDGYEMCQAIKQDPELQQSAVLILTGLEDPSEVIRALNAGADNFLTKSSTETHILARVKALLATPLEPADDQGVMQVEFAGQRHAIHATRRQTINLLLSTFENAVRQNRQLIETQQELKQLNQHLEEKVRQRTLELEVANRARSVFIANMSHELRTPMNAIIGMTEVVQNTPLNAEQQECLAVVRSASDTLLFFINSLLDFTQMAVGSLQIRHIPFCLREELQHALQTFYEKAREKKINFQWRVHNDVPDRLCGDFLRVKQVLAQLISNAIKFTQQGGVSVELSLTRADAEGVRICFAIQDTGIGLDPAIMDGLFESFVQGDGGTTRKYGGAGLGLSLAKGLLQLLNGRIWFESAVNEGSLFCCEMVFQQDDFSSNDRHVRQEIAQEVVGKQSKEVTSSVVSVVEKLVESQPVAEIDLVLVVPLLNELEQLLIANNLDAEVCCMALSSAVVHTRLYGLVEEMAQLIKDLDFDGARLCWQKANNLLAN